MANSFKAKNRLRREILELAHIFYYDQDKRDIFNKCKTRTIRVRLDCLLFFMFIRFANMNLISLNKDCNL